MWYFSWMLGIGFAVLLAVINAMWGEHAAERAQIPAPDDTPPATPPTPTPDSRHAQPRPTPIGR